MYKETPSDIDPKELINQETAKIHWHDLQRFFASGKTLHVHQGLDLIDAAVAMHQDDKSKVEHWMSNGMLDSVSDEEARTWFEQDMLVWAVVIAPWVLVQPTYESIK